MKILLMAPPWYRLQNASLSHYPAGPTYIAGALERVGYDSIVYNADYDPKIKSVVGGTNILNVNELTKKYNLYIKNLYDFNHSIWQEMRKMIEYFKPDILGVSVYTVTFKSALNIARIAKEIDKDIITIFGGPHPSIDPEGAIKEESVDFVVMNEGEVTIQELIKAIDNNSRDFVNIKGIAYKENNGDIRINSRRELVSDIDSIISVARHKLFQKELCPPSVFHMVYTSRGCPYHCIFCDSFNIWGRKKRSRSAEGILDEIERAHKDYKARYFYLCDDIFFYHKDIPRAYEFCEGLMKRKLKILWSTQTRAETINEKTEPVLKLMKKTGGQHISIGVETGSDRISKLIKKGNRAEDVRKAAEIIRKTGLYMSAFFMFGFPWETEEEIQQTLKLLKEINPTVAFPYIVTPTLGTELHKIAIDLNLIHPTFEFEKFYHESPEMGLSINIPKEKRKIIIDNVLEVFSGHNKKQFRRTLLKRWYFYYTLMKDYMILKNPRVFLGYVNDLIKKKGAGGKMDLNDKNVIITGASSGIGRSCAIEFIKNGSNVFLVSRNKEKLEKLRDELRAINPQRKVYIRITDVSNENDVKEMVKEIAIETGNIDILINTAGIGHFARIEDTTTDSFERIVKTNFGSVFYCIREVIPYMKRQGSGCIVNIASVVAYRGFPHMGIYSASKAAVKAFTEALRMELEKENISVILVSPGKTATSFVSYAIYEGQEKYRHTDKKGMDPQAVAKSIIKATRKNKKEIVLSLEGKVVTIFNRFAPFLLDNLIRSTRKDKK